MQDKPDNPVLIVGCGDIGRRVALRLQERNRSVTAVVRSAASARAAKVAGAHVLRVDLDRRCVLLGVQRQRAIGRRDEHQPACTDARLRRPYLPDAGARGVAHLRDRQSRQHLLLGQRWKRAAR